MNRSISGALKGSRVESLIRALLLGGVWCGCAALSTAAELPQTHEYQRVLRAYLAGLTEKDFAVEVKPFTVPATEPGLDELYRLWTLTTGDSYSYPRVHGVQLPASHFVLSTLESGDAVKRPGVDPLNLAWLADWKYDGNPYFGSRGLKNRAFVVAALDLMMLDAVHEQKPPPAANRSDALGGTLLILARTYGCVRGELPANVRTAYETGLKKFVLRLQEWGPKGSMTDMDLFAPAGLCYAAKYVNDPEVARIAESYSKRLFTDSRYFGPAGYFVDVGCFDASYNGISLYFTTWAALASDWSFVREALTKASRLKRYLSLPEPGGKSFYGPSHFSPRTSACSPHDQWGWDYRNIGAAMLTDEAMYLAPLPPIEELKSVPQKLAAFQNRDFGPVPELKPWRAVLDVDWDRLSWTSMNFAYEYYRKGFYERRAKLEAEKSPMLQPAFLRPGNFVRAFEKDFVMAKFDQFGVIIHTGVVGGDDGRWHRPYGFGGGALSAFWTPEAGPVLLGRRRGIQGNTFDIYDEWRVWPTHAITGIAANGRVVSSARIQRPEVAYDIGKSSAEVRVAGPMPKNNSQGEVLTGTVAYTRRFVVNEDGLQIESTAKGDGKDKLAELYEVIPVFLGDGYANRPTNVPPTRISFRVGKLWSDATPDLTPNVSEVRVTRQHGVIAIQFNKPQRVRLSPSDWVDGYLSQATCRNIMIDLLGNGTHPVALASVSVKYRIVSLNNEPK